VNRRKISHFPPISAKIARKSLAFANLNLQVKIGVDHLKIAVIGSINGRETTKNRPQGGVGLDRCRQGVGVNIKTADVVYILYGWPLELCLVAL